MVSSQLMIFAFAVELLVWGEAMRVIGFGFGVRLGF